MTAKFQARIRTSFGEVVIEEETAERLIEVIRGLPENFFGEIDSAVSRSFRGAGLGPGFDGIIEFTRDGPIIVSKGKLTHYEAIGLILYASAGRMSTAHRLNRLLEYSGIRSRVSSRLNEMAKRGLVYKPDPSDPNWKLTLQGERWVEQEILTKI